MSKEYDKIRKTWEIDPESKAHGNRKDDRTIQRRKERQNLNNMVGRISMDEDDLDDLDLEDDLI